MNQFMYFEIDCKANIREIQVSENYYFLVLEPKISL